MGATRYHAFISYSHAADARLAPALESGLKSFASRWLWLRALNIFRDKTSLSLTPALWPAIERALSETDFFILLASPDAAASPWVRREVEWWLQNRSVDKLQIVLTDGELLWDGAASRFDEARSSALPPALCTAFPHEPLWCDLRWARSAHDLKDPRFQEAVAEIASPIHGKPKDQLFGEDVRQHKLRMRWAAGAIVSLTVLLVTAIGLFVWAELNRREATTQRAEAEKQTGIARQQTTLAQQQTKVAEDQAAIARRQAQIARARQLVAQSNLLRTAMASDRQLSALLAAEASRRFHLLGVKSFEADLAVRQSLALLPQPTISWQMRRPIEGVAFTADGGHLVAVDRELETSTWNVRSRAHVASSAGTGAVLSVALSQGAQYLAVGTDSGAAYVQRASQRQELHRIAANEDAYAGAVAVSANGAYVAVAGRDTRSELTVNHLPSGTEVGRVPSSDAIAFGPASRHLAVGGEVWELVDEGGKRTLQPMKIAKVTAYDVGTLNFSPDGQYFVRTISTLERRVVEIWSVGRQTLLDTFSYDLAEDAIAVSRNARYVAVSTRGDSPIGFIVQLREPATGRAASIQTLTAPTAIAFSPHGAVLAIGEASGRITLWNISSVADVARFSALSELHDAVFDEDEQRLYTVRWDRQDDGETLLLKQVWDIRRARELRPARQRLPLTSHYFSPNGAYFAVADDAAVRVWETATNKLRARFPLSEIVALQVAISSDGRHVAALTKNRLQVWDVGSAKEVASLAVVPRAREFHFDGTTPRIVLGANGWYLARAFRSEPAGNTPGSEMPILLRVWDVKSGKELFTASLPGKIINNRSPQCAISSDGRHLAIGLDTEVVLRSLKTGDEIQTFREQELAGFSPDGRYLLTNASDVESSPFRNYSTAEGLRVHATQRAGGVARVWNLDDRSEAARVQHEPGTRPLGLSSTLRYLAAVGVDDSVRVSAVDSTALLAEACGRLTRNLTDEEWRRLVGDEPYVKTCPER